MFQSPSGVLGVCRLHKTIPVEGFAAVSVPFRGFRGLQVSFLPANAQGMSVSVPFRGFRGLQEFGQKHVRVRLRQFQSPSGVLGVCRDARYSFNPDCRLGFQSPSGVLGVCREDNGSLIPEITINVSVPFRGFRGLQEDGARVSGAKTLVSVPFRGFRGLQGRKGTGSSRRIH